MPPRVSPSNKRKPESQSSSSKKRPKIAEKKSKVEEVEENDDEEEENDEDEDEDNSNNDDDEEDDDNDNEDDNNGDGDDDDDENEVQDEDVKPKKKAAAKGKKVAAKKKKAAVKGKSKSATKSQSGKKGVKSSSNDDKISKLKKLSKLERLEEARKAFKWWEAPDLPDGINWRHLEQSGMVFAPNYIPHGIPMMYDKTTSIVMTCEQEELATFYAAIPEDGPQLGNKETRHVFQENFFKEFVTLFDKSQNISDFNKCDFSLIKQHLDLQKNLRKAATNEEKEIKKMEKEKIQLKHAFAIIDGRLEKVGNFNMEPPGLFRGRGAHPLTGTFKKRTFPESVTLNMSVDSCVPKCDIPGHAWGSVRHDPTVTWMCTWNENVQNQVKYVMLAASSTFKGKSDQDKYGTAIKLKSRINDIRKDYVDNIDSKESLNRQLGVAMWVIDRLALRVGGEKGENEADTVGCCSLRREHLTFYQSPGVVSLDASTDGDVNGEPQNFEIQLEFLGKDSMLYKQIIDFSNYGVTGKRVYKRLRSFCKNKEPEDQVFPDLIPSTLNKHLSSIMDGLTAKVFRTYNASVTLELELPTAESLDGLSVQEKVTRYNAANRQVAILCNHQKTVSKSAETMFENLGEKLAGLKRQQAQLGEWLKLVKANKGHKIPMKPEDKTQIKLQERLTKATLNKEKAKTNEEKLEAAEELDLLKAEIKKDQARRFEEKHMFAKAPTAELIKARIEKWSEEITKLEIDIRNREENKEVALGTSKINYMDPRISVAWCKRCEVPIDKVFAKTLRDKFNWAMAVDPKWKFE